MIEYVQKALENMAPELDSYYRRHIFKKSQIDKIVENRRRFENQLLRNKKRCNDYLAYIESELKLEKTRNKIIHQLGTGFEETDLLLQKNIISIYKRALHYFNDNCLLEGLVEYCIKRKCYEEMKDIFSTKCLKNVSNVDLWIFCAMKCWEIDDIDGARSMFLKLTAIKPSARTFMAFFNFECLYSQKINKLNEELGVEEEDKDDIERGEIAFAIFKEMMIKDRLKKEDIEKCIEISKIIPELKNKIIEYVREQ